MSSPFSVFRKHQKGMMAALVILAMVSFIVLGTADQFMRTGTRTNANDARVIAKWNGGEFTGKDINQVRYNRTILNQFIYNIRRVAAENKGDLRGLDDRPVYDTSDERGMVRTALLVEEAKKHGIVVTDDQVMDLIKDLSDNVVTDSQLTSVLRNMNSREASVTLPQLVEAFRHELTANQAMHNLYPTVGERYDALATPAQRWDYFCRINRRVKLQLYAFPVEQYLADSRIKVPDDAELRKFYDKYKNETPSPLSPEPGFRDPPGVKLEYLKADYLKFFNDAKDKLKEEEIRKDFEKDKVNLRETLEFTERMDSRNDTSKDDKESEEKDDGKPVVKATEPDPSPYEEAVGLFAKHAPKATEPSFTDEEVFQRNRELIVKRLADARARENMSKAIDEAFKKMDKFYASEYRRWSTSNSTEKDGKAKTSPTTPAPTYDLAKLANPDAGLTYHQTAMMSAEEMALDKYYRETYVNRRWGKEKDQPPVDNGVVLPTYAFQNKVLMSPFRAEDDIVGSAGQFYRNQYVFWRTAVRAAHTPEFADIKDRVIREWKIANDTGKSARAFAKERAKALADEINGNKTTLKEQFGDSPDVKETAEFTWYEEQYMPTGGGEFPFVRNIPRPNRLDEVEAGDNRFFRDVFRLADKQAGVAMNDSGSIVYVVQVFDAADTTRDALREQFLRSPYSRPLSPQHNFEQGYMLASAIDMARNARAWFRQLDKDYGVEWQEREAE